jgi:hypothetical protein
MQGFRYYWEYRKRFGKESSETWLKDFVISLLLAVIPILLAWGDRTVLQGASLAVEAVGLLFGFVALRHLVHKPLIRLATSTPSPTNNIPGPPPSAAFVLPRLKTRVAGKRTKTTMRTKAMFLGDVQGHQSSGVEFRSRDDVRPA